MWHDIVGAVLISLWVLVMSCAVLCIFPGPVGDDE